MKKDKFSLYYREREAVEQFCRQHGITFFDVLNIGLVSYKIMYGRDYIKSITAQFRLSLVVPELAWDVSDARHSRYRAIAEKDAARVDVVRYFVSRFFQDGHCPEGNEVLNVNSSILRPVQDVIDYVNQNKILTGVQDARRKFVPEKKAPLSPIALLANELFDELEKTPEEINRFKESFLPEIKLLGTVVNLFMDDDPKKAFAFVRATRADFNKLFTSKKS